MALKITVLIPSSKAGLACLYALVGRLVEVRHHEQATPQWIQRVAGLLREVGVRDDTVWSILVETPGGNQPRVDLDLIDEVTA